MDTGHISGRESSKAIDRILQALEKGHKEDRLHWKAGQVLNGHFVSFYEAGMRVAD